jgi:anti-sigma factor RsiW
MTCPECQDRLSALIDRELAGGDLKSVQEHTRGCAKCAHACVELLCIDAAARRADSPAAPLDLWERVEGAMAQRSDPRPAPTHGRAGGLKIVDFTSAQARLSRVGRK